VGGGGIFATFFILAQKIVTSDLKIFTAKSKQILFRVS